MDVSATDQRVAPDDRLLDWLEAVDEARWALMLQLEGLGDALARIRQARMEGQPMVEILHHGPGPQARARVRDAWRDLNESLHAYRAHTVRCMVEEDGLTLSEIARRTGKARQVVSRLYQFARRAP